MSYKHARIGGVSPGALVIAGIELDDIFGMLFSPVIKARETYEALMTGVQQTEGGANCDSSRQLMQTNQCLGLRSAFQGQNQGSIALVLTTKLRWSEELRAEYRNDQAGRNLRSL